MKLQLDIAVYDLIRMFLNAGLSKFVLRVLIKYW